MPASDPIAMFHKRLALVGLGVALCSLPPVLRVTQLTLAKGDELRSDAEARLVSRQWVPTTRGRIVDRNGIVLAADRPSFEVQIDYPVITGQWAYTQAAKAARKANRNWNELPPARRLELITEQLPHYQAQLDASWDELARVTKIPREEIEQRRTEIVEDVSRQYANVTEAARAKRIAELSLYEESLADVPTAEVAKPIAEQTQPHTLLHNIDDAIGFQLTSTAPGESSLLPPTLKLVDATSREYPFDVADVRIDRSSFPGPLRSEIPLTLRVQGIATHVIGAMRDRVHAEELAEGGRFFGQRLIEKKSDGTLAINPAGYTATDAVGHSGIEYSAEPDLRGTRGLITRQLDTDTSKTDDPLPGRDVRLTLDAKLQARIQALMSPQAGLTVVQPWQKNKALPIGTPLNGACVVIDVDSGDILSMVTAPSYSRQQLADDPLSLIQDEENTPLLNRAIARLYPPGSIVKPLMLTSAATAGVFAPDSRIACHGHLFPDNTSAYRCWIYKSFNQQTHSGKFGHDLDATEALMVSCNIFFFTLGQRLGPERIVDWYARFGVGEKAEHPALGIGMQADGRTTPFAVGNQPARDFVEPSEAIFMGIGQGPIAWTPLHAADAYATIARGGVRILPHLRTDQPAKTVDLGLNKRAVSLALRGLERAVNERDGTGHHIVIEHDDGTKSEEEVFNIPGVQVWGKSGTADAGKKIVGRDDHGKPIFQQDEHGNDITRDHAWFVVLAGNKGENRPRYAVALVVEFGGSGGRVSGPLCNQVLRALVEEGYLRGDNTTPTKSEGDIKGTSPQ